MTDETRRGLTAIRDVIVGKDGEVPTAPRKRELVDNLRSRLEANCVLGEFVIDEDTIEHMATLVTVMNSVWKQYEDDELTKWDLCMATLGSLALIAEEKGMLVR